MGIIVKFVRWLLEKFAAAALILGLGLIACGVWIFLRDSVDIDQWRGDMLRAINGERAHAQAALEDVRQRMDRISAEIKTENDRALQADRIIAQLNDMASAWDRYIGDREQQKTNDERLASLASLRSSIRLKLETLQRDLTRAGWERDGLQIGLGKLDAQIRSVEAQRSKVVHYLERTWEYPVGRAPLVLPVKWWMAIVLGLYFVGPTFGKCALYFGLAPLIARGRPVWLARAMAGLPEVTESHVTAEVTLRPGQRLLVKEKFLQASDEGLRRRTRYLLDWRIPVTCLATGLVELIEMSAGKDGESERRLTLSNQSDPHSELAIVTLAEGTSLVLRPGFLAGVIVQEGQRVRIRRRWQFFRWQAWATLQLRFFEFLGPCQLIIAGRRGVRVERLVDRVGEGVPARRTNQDSTMGFTPNLKYQPVRAETFWSYYRGMNPLFDDLFAGPGIFLCQQVSAPGEAGKARRFWSSVWGGILKVFGI